MTEIDTLIEEDRIIRGSWTRTDEQGRQLVCLLAAMSPEVAEHHRADACPAEIMPQWLAQLTPWMDDNGSDAAWPAMIRRYAALSKRWHVLDDAAWRRAEYRSSAEIVREAMRHTTNADALAVCGRVVALCERVVSGNEPSQDEWAACAARAARAAAWAAEAETEAARAAAWAAEAACAARAARAARAAAWAAEAATEAARAAAWAAEAACAARAAACAARAAAWAARDVALAAEAAIDRITTAILDAIEAEIVRAKG